MFRAELSGFEEVPPVLTPATGTFEARVVEGGIEFQLSYANLPTPAVQAHIHFAQPGVNGEIFGSCVAEISLVARVKAAP